ncbi:MAG: hypothetical protein ACLSHJ_04000 [Oscillospiraceae bacterium]
MGKLAGMCGNEDVFRVGTTGKSIVFFKENFLFSSRLMDGGYIDTDSLLKTISNRFTVLTDIKEMRDALFSVMSVAPDGRVRLSFQDQRLLFHCSGDLGSASAGIEVIALTGTPYGRILVQRTAAYILPESAWRYDHPWHRARRNADHQPHRTPITCKMSCARRLRKRK